MSSSWIQTYSGPWWSQCQYVMWLMGKCAVSFFGVSHFLETLCGLAAAAILQKTYQSFVITVPEQGKSHTRTSELPVLWWTKPWCSCRNDHLCSKEVCTAVHCFSTTCIVCMPTHMHTFNVVLGHKNTQYITWQLLKDTLTKLCFQK